MMMPCFGMRLTRSEFYGLRPARFCCIPLARINCVAGLPKLTC
jgi:hypothetical protein